MNYCARIFLKSVLFFLLGNFSSAALATHEDGGNAKSNSEQIDDGDAISEALKLLDRFIANPKGYYPDIKKVTFIGYKYGKDSKGNVKISDWKNINLEGTHFSYSEFIAADLIGAILTKAEFSHCNMSQIKLMNSNAAYSDHLKVIFNEANFYESNLEGSRFRMAEIQEAILSGAELGSAEFNNVNFFASLMKNLKAQKSRYSQVNFTNADLSESNFYQADFSEVSFVGTNLGGTNFSNAEFSGVNLYGADLEKAEFNNTKAEFDNPSVKSVYCEKPENVALSERSEEIGCIYYDILMKFVSGKYINFNSEKFNNEISIAKTGIEISIAKKKSQRNKKPTRQLSFKEIKIPSRKSLSRESSIKEENSSEKDATRYNSLGKSFGDSLAERTKRVKSFGRTISGGERGSPKTKRNSDANASKDDSPVSSPKESTKGTKRPPISNAHFDEKTER